MKPRKNWGMALSEWLFFFILPVIAIKYAYGFEWAVLYALSLPMLEFYLQRAEKDDTKD